MSTRADATSLPAWSKPLGQPTLSCRSRALRRNGEVLVSFQAGDGEAIVRPNAHGSNTTLTLFHHSPSHVADTLKHAGFAVHSTVTRDAELEHETTAQGFVMARRGNRFAFKST